MSPSRFSTRVPRRLSRRRFVGGSMAALAALSVCRIAPAAPQPGAANWFMPDEAAPHERTWMAFGASADIWGRDLLPEVRRNLATIANTIVGFEPVTMLVRPEELALARSMLKPAVKLVPAQMDDLWIRDTGPVFVLNRQGERAAIDFNFNGWGEKQTFDLDADVAAFVAAQAGARLIATDLVLEGGAIEVDGQGTAILAESCVLHDNRNPGLDRAALEELLMPLLGLSTIIWIPGIADHDITDGHTDFYARFARPGVVTVAYDPDENSFDHEVTKAHLDILAQARDAHGREFEIFVLEAPSSIRPEFDREEFAASYAGFYVCNGAVIAQRFGDETTDRETKQLLAEAFPGRQIVQIDIDGIAAGGGSVHCATQQQPLALAG